MYISTRNKRNKLLKPRNKPIRLRLYSTIRCPLNGHQVSWCRMLCRPQQGIGTCGRPAPHAMRDRTQIAISRYKAGTVRN